MEATHDFNVQWLQRVTSGLDEVDAGMDSVVDDIGAVDFILRIKICVESLIDIVHYRLPRLVVVDKVTKSGSVDDCQTKTNPVLLNVCADRLDSNSLWLYVHAWRFALFRRI